jgi:hypothetical protein
VDDETVQSGTGQGETPPPQPLPEPDPALSVPIQRGLTPDEQAGGFTKIVKQGEQR